MIFTANVREIGSGLPVLTGNVTFKNGATVLGIVPVNNGVASLQVCNLPAGSHSIAAAFADPTPGSDYQPSFGTLTQVVNGPREVPETDTLLLLGGGIGGLATWLRWQWQRRKSQVTSHK